MPQAGQEGQGQWALRRVLCRCLPDFSSTPQRGCRHPSGLLPLSSPHASAWEPQRTRTCGLPKGTARAPQAPSEQTARTLSLGSPRVHLALSWSSGCAHGEGPFWAQSGQGWTTRQGRSAGEGQRKASLGTQCGDSGSRQGGQGDRGAWSGALSLRAGPGLAPGCLTPWGGPFQGTRPEWGAGHSTHGWVRAERRPRSPSSVPTSRWHGDSGGLGWGAGLGDSCCL